MKICIIGGGSTYTPELLAGLIRLHATSEICEIRLLDIIPGQKKLDILADFGQRMLSTADTGLQLFATLIRGCLTKRIRIT